MRGNRALAKAQRGAARLRRMLTAAEARIAELEKLAGEDALTGILNRRGFERELGRALAFSSRYGKDAALVFVDLDDFKLINDAHGHLAGDATLKAVADTLLANVRRSDIVARIGGDEFVVVLWGASLANAAMKAESLRGLIEALRPPGAGAVAISVGVTGFRHEDDALSLIARADAAMYADKARRKAGRNGLERPV